MNTDTQQPTARKPSLYVYTKVADGRSDRIGSRIGVAFYHKDETGLNILLDAVPIPVEGRIELVGFKPDGDNSP